MQFAFATLPGKPRLITWREISKAAMAMIQFMGTHEQGFRELRADITRGGAVIGRAEVNMLGGGQIATLGSGIVNITAS